MSRDANSKQQEGKTNSSCSTAQEWENPEKEREITCHTTNFHSNITQPTRTTQTTNSTPPNTENTTTDYQERQNEYNCSQNRSNSHKIQQTQEVMSIKTTQQRTQEASLRMQLPSSMSELEEEEDDEEEDEQEKQRETNKSLKNARQHNISGYVEQERTLKKVVQKTQLKAKIMQKMKKQHNIRKRKRGVPSDFLDPIHGKIMYDPVVTETGITYERKSIEKWLMRSNVDPKTATILKTHVLIPNVILKSQIISFLEMYPRFKREQYRPTLDEDELIHLIRENQLHKVSHIEQCERIFSGKQNIFHLTARYATSTQMMINMIQLFLKMPKTSTHDKFMKQITQTSRKEQLKEYMMAKGDGYTVIDIALFHNRFELFELLRKLMVSLEATYYSVLEDEHSTIPLNMIETIQEQFHAACEAGEMEAVKLLMKKAAVWERTQDWYPIEKAAAASQYHIVKLLLEQSHPMHHTSIKRYMALSNAICVAARCGAIDVIQLLLDHDVSIVSTSQKYYFPLNQACFAGKYETVAFLIEKGANVTMTVKRFSAISAAAEAGHLEIVKLLIQHGASIHPSKRIDICPLFSAAEQSQCEVVKYLIEKGADINYQYENGYSALHYVVQHNSEYIPLERRKEVIQLLVLNGASLDLRNNQGDTPIDIAIAPLKPFLRRLRASQNRTPFVNSKAIDHLTDELKKARLSIATMTKQIQAQDIRINRLYQALRERSLPPPTFRSSRSPPTIEQAYSNPTFSTMIPSNPSNPLSTTISSLCMSQSWNHSTNPTYSLQSSQQESHSPSSPSHFEPS